MSPFARSPLVLLVLALSACRERQEVPKDTAESRGAPRALEGDAALGDDDEDASGDELDNEAGTGAPVAASRCQPTGPEQAFPPGKVELGRAVSLGAHRYAVPYLRDSAPVRASVSVVSFDGATTVRTFDLGEVHGQVEPPRVVAGGARAERLFAAVVDSDATSSTLRLASVQLDDGTVTWGPIARAGRGESTAFTLARASTGVVLMWDRVDSSTSRSSLFAISAPSAFAESKGGAEVRVTPVLRDIDSPLLVPVGDDFWLVAVRYEELPQARGAGEADSLGLIEEPPRQLVVARLDRSARITSDFVVLDRLEAGELSFDASALGTGQLLVAHASDSRDGISLTTVGPDGVPSTEPVPGASWGVPTLLGDGDARLLVLAAASGPQLVPLDAAGHPKGAPQAERGLAGGFPLEAQSESLFVARTSGTWSTKLAELRCAWSLPEAASPTAAP